MQTTIRESSKITAKGQTTIPKSVRQVLGVDRGGLIDFLVADGRVTIEASADQHEDPVLGSFLSFLARDMEKNPSRITPLPSTLRSRIEALIKGMTVDLEEPIEGDVAL